MKKDWPLVAEVARSLSDDDLSAMSIIRRDPRALAGQMHSLVYRGVMYQYDGLVFLTEFGKDVWDFEE
jgi:hypothetical protein